MTPAERRQAAVEVKARAGLYDVENIVRRENAAVKLADHTLAVTTFDDAEPVSFEWMASQAEHKQDEGYWDVPPSGDVWWEVGRLSFTCDDYQSDPGEPVEVVATDWQVDGEKLPKLLVPKTRGDFRRLCEIVNEERS